MSNRAGIPRKWTVADSAEIYGVKYWGHNYFSDQRRRATSVAHPAGADGPTIDLKELVDEVAPPRHRPAAADPLLRRAQEPHRRAQRDVQARHRRVRLQGRSTRASTRSRSTSTATWSRRSSSSGAPTTTASRPGRKPELLAVMAMLDDEDALIICNGYKDEEYIETALMASKLGRTVLIVVEKFSRAGADRRGRQEDRRAAAHRHPRASWRPRASGRWEASGGDRSKFGLSTREVVEAINFLRANDLLELLRAAALPPRQPDLRHPRRQERAARGGALLRRGLQAGRAAQVLRRGRRPGRRLRRLADQLRVVDELHDAGVRQRHRVLAAGDLRRGGRPAPDHRHRVGPRGRGAPLDAGGRHPGRRRVRRRQGARARSPATPRAS